MNYKPRYKTIGPRKEIMVSLPQITDEMKLKHKYIYSESENLEDFVVDDDIEEDTDNIGIDLNIKKDTDLNRSDAILNENIQVHTFDSNQRIRYDKFFDNSDIEDNTTTPSKKESVDDDEFQPNSTENETEESESEFIDVDSDSDYTPHIIPEEKSPKEIKKKRKADRILYSTKHIDDGDELYYQVNILININNISSKKKKLYMLYIYIIFLLLLLVLIYFIY